jgi:hypothetical protein
MAFFVYWSKSLLLVPDWACAEEFSRGEMPSSMRLALMKALNILAFVDIGRVLILGCLACVTLNALCYLECIASSCRIGANSEKISGYVTRSVPWSHSTQTMDGRQQNGPYIGMVSGKNRDTEPVASIPTVPQILMIMERTGVMRVWDRLLDSWRLGAGAPRGRGGDTLFGYSGVLGYCGG